MPNKKVLIVSGLQIFPAQSGGQIRTATMAESLGLLGFDVTIYSYTGRRADYLKLRRSSYNVIGQSVKEFTNRNFIYAFIQLISYRLAIPPLWLTLFSRFYVPSELRKLIKESKLVIIDFPFLYPLTKSIDRPCILNSHNVEHHIINQQHIFKNLLTSLIQKIEINAVKSVDHTMFCTQKDMDFLGVFAKHKFTLVSNGVNLTKINAIRSEKSRFCMRKKLGITSDTKLVLFSASAYYSNLESYKFLQLFCHRNQDLLAGLKLKFLILGSVADKAVDCRSYITTSRVDNVYEYFLACDAAINPVMLGSGSNIKMAEYISFYLPILTTEFGARGLNMVDGRDCIHFTRKNLALVLESQFTHKNENFFRSISENAYMNNVMSIDMKTSLRSVKYFIPEEK